MVYTGILLIVYMVEMFTAYIFFSQAGEKRYKTVHCCLIGLGLFLFALFVNVVGGNIVWLNVICFTLVNIVFGYICFNINYKKVVVYSIILVTISMIWEYVVEYVLAIITGTAMKTYLENNTILILIGSSKILYFLSSLILSKFIVKEKKVTIPVSLYIYPVSVLISVLISWYVCAYCEINKTGQIAIAIMTLIFFISTIFMFLTYQRNIEKENEFFQLKNEINKLEIEKNYYDILEQQNQDLMIYAHDTKKHLTTIKNLNSNPEIEEYIDIMDKSLESYSQVSHSGNHTLDVIINKYVTECKIKNIKFSFDISLKNLNYIKDFDLVTIIGNILDNAIESADKSKAREITLETNYRNTYDILIITNSCDTAPKSSKDTLLTTKNDKKIHGVGLKSVAKVLKNYDGHYDWKYDFQSHKFTSIVTLTKTQ